MKLFNSIFNPFVSNGRFEANTRGHTQLASHFFSFSELKDFKVPFENSVDFYFEAGHYKNALSLKEDLQLMDYTVDEILRRHEYSYFITGKTCPFLIDPYSLVKWVQRMNETGYINDCLFDGWGILNTSSNI